MIKLGVHPRRRTTKACKDREYTETTRRQQRRKLTIVNMVKLQKVNFPLVARESRGVAVWLAQPPFETFDALRLALPARCHSR
jgi:hypothetical protein